MLIINNKEVQSMKKSYDYILKLIDENHIKLVHLMFCDILSKLKDIAISPDSFVDAIENGVEINSHAINGFKTSDDSQLLIFPDPDTIAVITYEEGVNSLLCYCDIKYSNGEDFKGDLRQLLRNTMNSFKTQDLEYKIGFGCEFYLFKLDESGNSTPIPYDDASYLATPPDDKCLSIRRDISNILNSIGIKTTMSYHAAGPAQNKMILECTDALEAADNLLTFKFITNLVAQRYKLHACFSPKPIKNRDGNDLKINIELYKDNINILEFSDERYANIIKKFKEGIVNKLYEMNIFLNPVMESYDRINTTFRAAGKSWSEKLTSEAIMIDSRSNIQLTSPDMEANPYIALSLIIKAGLENEDNESSSSDDRIQQLSYIDVSVPSSYKGALDAARASKFLKSSLPDDILNPFFFIKYSKYEESISE